MRIRDEEGDRAMQAAGKAWRAIKITSSLSDLADHMTQRV
jgi:hypothetical protein